MKKIKFTCSNCQAKLRVPTHLAGVTAPCPKCGHKITAPTDFESIVDDDPAPRTRAAVAAPQARQRVGTTSAAVKPAVEHSVATVPVEKVPAARQMDQGMGDLGGPVLPAPKTPQPLVPPPVTDEPVVRENTGPLVPPTYESPEDREVPPASNPVGLPPLDLPAKTTVSEPLFPGIDLPAEQSISPESPPATELPEPAVPKTQPIKVTARPDHLPEMRPALDEDSAEGLPRLDISLGEASASGTSSSFLNKDSAEKTRLHLPQPGDLSDDEDLYQFSPDDFIIPADEKSEPIAAPPSIPPVPEITESSVGTMPLPRESDEKETFPAGAPLFPEPEMESEAPAAQSAPVTQPEAETKPEEDLVFEPRFPMGEEVGIPPAGGPPALPAVSEPEGFPGSAETPTAVENKESFFAQLEESVPEETAPEPNRFEPESAGSLHEGSFESLLAQQATAPSDLPPREDVSAETSLTTIPIPEVSESSGGSQIPFPSATVPVSPPRSDSDVLDEMFGSSSGESKGMSKSTVVMLCSIGAVVIIATVLVIVIGIAFGGFSVPDPGEEVAGDDATSMLMAKKDKESATSSQPTEPSIDDAPAVIDPVAVEKVTENRPEDQPAQPPKSTVTLPGDTSKPVKIYDANAPSSLAKEEGLNDVVAEAKRALQIDNEAKPPAKEETTFSLDDAVDRTMGGQEGVGSEVPTSFTDAGSSLIGSAPSIDPGSTDNFPSAMPVDPSGTADAKATGDKTGSGALENYNPPESFAAPGPDDSPLAGVNDLIDAFLRAPDWQTRLKYCYMSESLRPAIEEYYQKWPDKGFTRFSQQMFQMELDEDMGGPYWVYLISTSDEDQGFPLIVRVEDGKLKVDWEIFAEFNDRHFAKFEKGEMPNPGTYRVVLERKSDYYGPDRDAFKNLGDYYVYEVNAPYGGLNEFSEYAFVKSDSDVAKELDEVLGLGDEPLAVILTLERANFDHGTEHLVIKDYVTEGWFR